MLRREVRIGDRVVGEDQPLFIVAECGVTCNYDVGIAKRLIDVVAESGADAIKFLFWFPEEIMSDRSITYEYETVKGPASENMYEMLQSLRFTFEEWREVKAHADARGVLLFSTVNSPGGIDYAERLGLEAYKLSSWDFNYFPLWERIAAIGKPMIIDTGPVGLLDVARVMEITRAAGNSQVILVHCVHTQNHTEINMRAIPYMRSTFGTLVGYSSNFLTHETDIIAIALGAVFLENRLTLDRELPGHHHVISKEPDEFTAWVKTMREAQASLGEPSLLPSLADLQERKRWFRHLVANRKIPAGTVLTEEMLECKRPEEGISPEHMRFFLGRTTKRDLDYNEALAWDVV